MTSHSLFTLTLAGAIIFVCFGLNVFQSENQDEIEPISIGYTSAALGSGMGMMQPTFKVNGNTFIYTYEQNSYYGQRTKEPDTLCIGKFRQSSIDSIIQIASAIDDTLIYRTNIFVMSGGIHYVWIESGKVDLTFHLHNAFDSTAQEIVDILNTHIPAPHPKLRLSPHPHNLGLNDTK